MVGSQAWVHIAKENSVKLDVRSWQEIFIGYEGKNQYRVYNSRTGKFHITRDIVVDEQHLYYRKAFGNDCDFSEDDWVETHDAQFADMSDLDDSETASPLLLDGFPYSVEENIPKQPEKGENGSQDLEQDLTTFDDLESELLEPPIEESSETNSGSIESSR